MNGRTAKLLRKASGGDRMNYRRIKHVYNRSDIDTKKQAKTMAAEVNQVRAVEAQNEKAKG